MKSLDYNPDERANKVSEILSEGTIDLIRQNEEEYAQYINHIGPYPHDKSATLEMSIKQGDKSFTVITTETRSPICKLDSETGPIQIDAKQERETLCDMVLASIHNEDGM